VRPWSNGVTSTGTLRQVDPKGILGLGESKWRLGGTVLCFITRAALIKPAIPAAASRCPTFVFTDPREQRRRYSRPRLAGNGGVLCRFHFPGTVRLNSSWSLEIFRLPNGRSPKRYLFSRARLVELVMNRPRGSSLTLVEATHVSGRPLLVEDSRSRN